MPITEYAHQEFLDELKKVIAKPAFGTVVVLREQNRKYEKNIICATIMRTFR